MFIRYLCGCVKWHGEKDPREISVFICPGPHTGSHVVMTEDEIQVFLLDVRTVLTHATFISSVTAQLRKKLI